VPLNRKEGSVLIELIIIIMVLVMVWMVASITIPTFIAYRDKILYEDCQAGSKDISQADCEWIYEKVAKRKSKEIKLKNIERIKEGKPPIHEIVCIEGFKWVKDGTNIYQLGEDDWGYLEPISCE
jgi:hypothetical protein